MTTAIQNKKSVGLIGIGLLGTALAERLLHAGYDVWGHDTSATAMNTFATLGGRAVDDVQGASSEGCPVVLCLPTTDIVAQVVDRIILHMKPGGVLIDTTTGEPSRTRQLSERLNQAQVQLIDASILGSSEVTRAGDAVILAGGSSEAIANCRSVLEAISEKLFHVGPVGSGQEMKLVANLVLGLNRAAMAEGLHFARTFDLDLNTVLEVLKSGAAYSAVMDTKGKKMIEEDFQPQARLSQHLKDVRLILQHAQNAGTKLPLSQTHRMLLESVESAGDGGLDNSAVIKAWSLQVED